VLNELVPTPACLNPEVRLAPATNLRLEWIRPRNLNSLVVQRRWRSTIPNRMVRINAFILILALIVAPVASLCATPSGVLARCPRLCPMHGKMGTHTSASETYEMDCYHGKSPEDCVMKGCGHTVDFGLASPLPPAVLCPQLKLTAIGTNGTVCLGDSISSLVGFHTPPVQPPRA